MLNIKTLILGEYRTNCYIVYDDGQSGCVIIDPGYEPQTILSQVQALGLQVEAIFLTHGHFDHVGGVKTIAAATGCQVWMKESDYSQKPLFRMVYPLANTTEPEIWFYEDGEELTRAGLQFTVLTTPGHTWGSVCIRCQDALFSGDTLFAGSWGRTDLPGGDSKWMAWSLQRLGELEGDCRVYPGHGPGTTLARERMGNPYMG